MKIQQHLKYLLFFVGLSHTTVKGQVSKPYEAAYTTLEKMCLIPDSIDFKKAVFTVENAFLGNQISEQGFNKEIATLLNLAKAKYKAFNTENALVETEKVKQYESIFKVMTDTTFMNYYGEKAFFLPFRYNFDDMFGEKDWSNMFITKLLATHKGNCHSMPYLYKILCDELGISCHLALAPNHIYIKHLSEKVGWYNTELTSGSFPIDAWIMASGYIPLEAIQNGIYMEALDDKKCLTLCVYDLAKGFDRKNPDNDGAFIIKCCDLALAHFPNFINATILKAETRKRQCERLMKEKNISTPKALGQQKEGKALWNDMNSLYAKIHSLGYRAMPEKMYVDWLVSLKKEREKYSNKQVTDN